MGVLRQVFPGRVAEDYVGADVSAELERELGVKDWEELDSMRSFRRRSTAHGLDYVRSTSQHVRYYVFFRGGRAVGTCTMHTFPSSGGAYEISYVQARPELRGQGIGRDMYMVLLDDEGLTLVTRGLLTPHSAGVWVSLWRDARVTVRGHHVSYREVPVEVRPGDDGRLHAPGLDDDRLMLSARWRDRVDEAKRPTKQETLALAIDVLRRDGYRIMKVSEVPDIWRVTMPGGTRLSVSIDSTIRLRMNIYGDGGRVDYGSSNDTPWSDDPRDLARLIIGFHDAVIDAASKVKLLAKSIRSGLRSLGFRLSQKMASMTAWIEVNTSSIDLDVYFHCTDDDADKNAIFTIWFTSDGWKVAIESEDDTRYDGESRIFATWQEASEWMVSYARRRLEAMDRQLTETSDAE